MLLYARNLKQHTVIIQLADVLHNVQIHHLHMLIILPEYACVFVLIFQQMLLRVDMQKI